MAEPGKADDRLPWLDAPRTPPRRPPAARRAQRPLLVLLGLFVAGAVAVMAFLAGRGSAPVAPSPVVETMPARPPAASVTLPAPTAPPLIAEVAPDAAPAATPAEAAPPAAPTVAARPVKKRAKIKRPVVARSASRAIARQERWVAAHRARPRQTAAIARYHWPKPSTTAPSGRVVQLGAYYSGRQTMAAWQRLRRAYPYLATLPRRVTVIPARDKHPRYFRLRIGAGSPEQARAVCDQLHRIGRGCIVV